MLPLPNYHHHDTQMMITLFIAEKQKNVFYFVRKVKLKY